MCWGALLCLLVASGCEKIAGSTRGNNDGEGALLGADCTKARDCASAVCLKPNKHSGVAFCSQGCSADKDCQGERTADGQKLVCGIGLEGEKACVRPCAQVPGNTSGSLGLTQAVACIEGVATACDFAGQAECLTCGCPDGQRCEPGVGCQGRSEQGGPCRKDADCRTLNCSASAHVCRVPEGQPCTKDNCDRCMTGPNGFSFCSRECANTGCAEGECLAVEGEPGYCEPPCSASCPGTCEESIDKVQYCECADATCPRVGPLRSFGQECARNADCQSGVCTQKEASPASSNGYCSKSCVNSAECGQTGICLDLVNVVAVPDASAKRCAPRCGRNDSCDVGYCMPVGGAKVCELRLAGGATCANGNDCQSGQCLNGSCKDTAALGIGEACSVPVECESGNCVSGICRGNLLLGDSCMTDPECAAGKCCPAMPSGKQCKSSC